MFSVPKTKNKFVSGKPRNGVLKNPPKPAKKISEILSQCNYYQENGVQVIESGKKVVFYCTLCQAWAHNDHTLEEHLKGKKHTFNKSCQNKKDVTPAVKNFVESVTKQPNWFVKSLDSSLPEWMHYWPSDIISKKNIKSKSKSHQPVQSTTRSFPSSPPVARSQLNQPPPRPNPLSDLSEPNHSVSQSSNPTLVHPRTNSLVPSRPIPPGQIFIDLTESEIEYTPKLSWMNEFVPSALVLFSYNDKLGREKGQLMPSSNNASSMEFDESPYSIPSGSEPLLLLCSPDAECDSLKEKYVSNENEDTQEPRYPKQSNHRNLSVAIRGKPEESVLKVKGNEIVCSGDFSKLTVGGLKKGWMSEIEMKKKVFQQGFYKRRKVNQRICYICQQSLENGCQVATLLNLETGEFACSSRNRFGMFHVFHSLCLGNWTVYQLTLLACKDENDGNVYDEMGKIIFCPECQGTGSTCCGSKLEKPRFQLSEVYDKIFEMIKSQNQRAKIVEPFSETTMGESKKIESGCRLHFYDATKQKAAETISKNLKFFWFGSPDFESVMSITRNKQANGA